MSEASNIPSIGEIAKPLEGKDNPYSIDAYLAKAKETTASMPKVTFEELPDICAEYLEAQSQASVDLETVKEMMEQLEAELFQWASAPDGYFKMNGATNKETREAAIAVLLGKHEGYQALDRRYEDIKHAKALAESNYKRYSRRFEVLNKQAEEALLAKRQLIIGELLHSLPSGSF